LSVQSSHHQVDVGHTKRIKEREASLYSGTIYNNITEKKVKDKAFPLQAWRGPEGSRDLRFPVLMTTAQDGGRFVNLTHRPPLPPGNTPGTPFC
jgi:hypothetical protein